MTENNTTQQDIKHRDDHVIKKLLSTVGRPNPIFKIWIIALLVIIFVGCFAYYRQLRFGLIVTSMRDYTSWGIYISNFVFFVAVSLIGSLVSSILKLAKVKWSYPLTRISEIIAVAAIICAAVIIIVDMGRPDRFLNVIFYGRIQSPIIWDVLVIMTYLIISVLLLYLPMLPDIALCRDRLKNISIWRQKMYKILALNWQNKPGQLRRLKKTSTILEIMVIPVAFAIHTITSWLFATTWRPGWDSTNLGPYFVSGAFMLGAAVIIIAMFFIRRSFRLEDFITNDHFDKMAKILVLLSLVYLYFNINEYLGPAFKMVGVEGEHITELFSGDYATMYWLVQIPGLMLPILVMLFKFGRKPFVVMIVSFFVLMGAWFKRFLIVIPSLQHPYLPIQDVDESYLHYYPSWEEWAITLASFAGVLLIITVLLKLFPIIPIQEYINHQDNGEVQSTDK
ncbi:polysulfide reductase [Ancylomarina euxinus]|uniref:Polysulfide reductase n=1 Tax=Ancylomarina euxinus TaxID=2283627 RepID=A0A425XZR2_9BACT|nr:NrfD/PsrC family molybdoenzyme membrane anchor subunit [Ancylomarina euxinus]MCZ4695419.1 polysulfide reductase NrfD [Ancylomarina euxinus]MUP15615.1 polysulfide reductase [Ancylomarina euxinus]RRG20945.1 polysulfide reductase [Ancylomarina euxinus]